MEVLADTQQTTMEPQIYRPSAACPVSAFADSAAVQSKHEQPDSEQCQGARFRHRLRPIIGRIATAVKAPGISPVFAAILGVT